MGGRTSEALSPASVRFSVEDLRPAGERASAGARHGTRVERSLPALAPRDAGGILDLALDGLVARIGPCLALAVAIHVLQQLLLPRGGMEFFFEDWSWVLPIFFPLAATSVIVSLVGDVLEDPARPLGPALARGLACVPAAVVLLVLTNFATVPLLFLCFAPYFLVQWRTWAALPVYVLEGERLLDAVERERRRRSPLGRLASIPVCMGRSLARGWRLSRGASALGRWVLLAIVGQLVLCGLLDGASGALSYPEAQEFLQQELALGSRATELFISLISALFLGLSACVRASLMVAFALDLRVRHEGRDLELALERAERGLPMGVR